MYFITLRFNDKTRAPLFMEAHNEWIRQGFADGVFLVVGGLNSGQGGAILAHGEPREAIEARLSRDPFVAEGIVTLGLDEVQPGRADDRLSFLKA